MNFKIAKIKLIFNKLEWDIEKIPSKSTITFLNPYSYLLTRNSKLLENIDFIGIDGILLKTIFNFFLKNKIERRSFDATSLAPILYKHCINNKKSIYFIGSTSLNINTFSEIIKKNMPELNVIDFRNGYFSSLCERITVINDIINLNPDFVVVGMGTPYQENFILDLKKGGYEGIAFTCGGYFHQTSKAIDYYPWFFNKFNLRWVYRIIDEPKLIKRYIIYYPKALFYILLDLLEFKRGEL